MHCRRHAVLHHESCDLQRPCLDPTVAQLLAPMACRVEGFAVRPICSLSVRTRPIW